MEHISLNTKADILAVSNAMDQLEEKAKAVATYLGFLDGVWKFESFSIGTDNVVVIAYDQYYDLHDTTHILFPIECLFDDTYLKTFKEQRDEAMRIAEENKRLEDQKRIEANEKAELKRLKAKYE